jgi:hypothetical protein
MPDDPYSRLYWRFADEFPAVYEDDAAYALWCRLLRLADMAWPVTATLPMGTRKTPLVLLVKEGLVVMVTPSTYRIRGMVKERKPDGSLALRRRLLDAPSTTRPTPR